MSHDDVPGSSLEPGNYIGRRPELAIEKMPPGPDRDHVREAIAKADPEAGERGFEGVDGVETDPTMAASRPTPTAFLATVEPVVDDRHQ